MFTSEVERIALMVRALRRTVWALQDCRDHGDCLLPDHLDALEAGETLLEQFAVSPLGPEDLRRNDAETAEAALVTEDDLPF